MSIVTVCTKVQENLLLQLETVLGMHMKNNPQTFDALSRWKICKNIVDFNILITIQGQHCKMVLSNTTVVDKVWISLLTFANPIAIIMGYYHSQGVYLFTGLDYWTGIFLDFTHILVS